MTDPTREALHELCWSIAFAGQDERGNLYPPLPGELERARVARALAAILQAEGPTPPAASSAPGRR